MAVFCYRFFTVADSLSVTYVKINSLVQNKNQMLKMAKTMLSKKIISGYITNPVFKMYYRDIAIKKIQMVFINGIDRGPDVSAHLLFD